jgi:carbonic anhydrase/acetyltransferase-like protein (isoleucine patch superfamily)
MINLMKYRIRMDLTKHYCGLTLYRIERLSDRVLGGWIEKEENLSQLGAAWVADDALVSGNARISDDARVSDNARISGNARVYGKALVSDNARISGNALVFDNARVYSNALVSDNAQVYGVALVSGKALVSDNARISGNALVYGNAQVNGNARVSADLDIFHAIVGGRFNITITPQNIVIGCKIKSRTQWLKITEKEAFDMGLPKELYPIYRRLIKAGLKLVKRKSKNK